jgi:hypothetical protein
LWWMCIVTGAAQWLMLAAFRMRRVQWAMAGGMLALWMVCGLWAFPLLNDSSSSSELMAKVRSHLGPQDEIGLVNWTEQNLLMLNRPATDFGFTVPGAEQFVRGVQWQAQAPATRWLFAQDAAIEDCVHRDKAIDLGNANRRGWWMFKFDAVVPGCVPTGNTSSTDDP